MVAGVLVHQSLVLWTPLLAWMLWRKCFKRAVVVGLVAVMALFFLARERLVPWIADRSVLDPGERVKQSPALVDAETGDSLLIQRGADHLHARVICEPESFVRARPRS